MKNPTPFKFDPKAMSAKIVLTVDPLEQSAESGVPVYFNDLEGAARKEAASRRKAKKLAAIKKYLGETGSRRKASKSVVVERIFTKSGVEITEFDVSRHKVSQGMRINVGFDVPVAVHQGLPWQSLANVKNWVGVPESELLGVIGMAPRTAARRKKGEDLTRDESDRLARVARVMAEAVRVFGSTDKAQRWMARPHSWFGGKTPLSMLSTDYETQMVTDELGRIEYGELLA